MKRIFVPLILLISSMGYAQGPTVLDPCKTDLYQYCQGIEPGGGKLLTCLNNNMEKLSSSCRNRTQRLVSLMKEVRGACNNDLLKFCDNVEPGEGRIFKCLHEHATDLNISCKMGIDNLKAARQDMFSNPWP